MIVCMVMRNAMRVFGAQWGLDVFRTAAAHPSHNRHGVFNHFDNMK